MLLNFLPLLAVYFESLQEPEMLVFGPAACFVSDATAKFQICRGTRLTHLGYF